MPVLCATIWAFLMIASPVVTCSCATLLMAVLVRHLSTGNDALFKCQRICIASEIHVEDAGLIARNRYGFGLFRVVGKMPIVSAFKICVLIIHAADDCSRACENLCAARQAVFRIIGIFIPENNRQFGIRRRPPGIYRSARAHAVESSACVLRVRIPPVKGITHAGRHNALQRNALARLCEHGSTGEPSLASKTTQ